MQLLTPPLQTLMNLDLPAYPSVTGLPQPITIHSIAHFSVALLWSWLLLVSFTGWGRLAGKLFRVSGLPASVACSIGIATVIFLGGLLNLLHGIYPAVIFSSVGVGCLFYVSLGCKRSRPYRLIDFWNRASKWTRMLLILTTLILICRVAATVRLGGFNVNDDSTAYLVFPQKMLASHHFAADPFSDRRVISSLGGSYLLQSFVIAATSLSHIAMADRTLGLVLLAAALFDLGILFGLSPLQIALMEFLAYLAPQETINTTFVILPISLLLAMLWLVGRTDEKEDECAFRKAFLVGILGGAIICLKSTYLPIVGAYALIPYSWMNWRAERRKSLMFALTAGLGALIVLLAWMLAMKTTSGTYLFPVLGRGLDYSSYGLFRAVPQFQNHRTIIKIFLQGCALLVLIFIQFRTGIRNKLGRLSLGVLAASALAITAFNYRSGGDFIWRYNFPQFLCAILFFYAATAAAFREHPDSKAIRLAGYAGVLSLAGMMFYYDAAGHNPRPFRQMQIEAGDYRTALRASLSGVAIANPALQAEYRAVEQIIPDGQSALEDTGRPYLFDYRKHAIYVMDWPGAASPRPGWPVGRDSAQLAEYLQYNSIRYIAYDYRYAAWNDAGACVSLHQPERYSTELYVLFWMVVLTDHQLDQLRARYQSIYDDGKIAVVDLGHPAAKRTADPAAWTLQTDKEEMCSAVLAKYQANSLSP